MERIRIGVIGAGAVAQIEHLPNIDRLTDRFSLCGACDPSAEVRSSVAARYDIPAFATLEELLATSLDAVVIASPDALHREQVLAAFAAGLHVFCEKPLALGQADIADMIAARDSAGKVLQVGYMKRFDPAYVALVELLPSDGELLQISVEVCDPDAGPFVRHHEWCRGDDLPAVLREVLERRAREQVARAVPVPLDEDGYRGFCSAYASALVHDVNAVHGLLDRLGIGAGEVVGAQLFAGGRGGQGAVRLNDGRALWTMSYLTVPRLPYYAERIALVFEGVSFELMFPSPWLNHHPTGLTIRRGRDMDLLTEVVGCGYAEAFVEELRGFHAAVTEGAAVRNTAEAAARDMALLAGLAARHAGGVRQERPAT